MLIGATILIGLIAINPDVILFALLGTYIVSGPLMEMVSMKRIAASRKAAKAKTSPKAQKFYLLKHQGESKKESGFNE